MKLIISNIIFCLIILVTITLSYAKNVEKTNMQLYQEAKLYKKNGNINKSLDILINIHNEEPNNIQFFNLLKNILKIKKENAPILEKHVIKYCNAKKNDPYSLLEKLDYLLWVEDEQSWIDLAYELINNNLNNKNYIRMVIGRIIAYNEIEKVYLIVKKLRTKKNMESFFSLEMANYFKYGMQPSKAINEYFLFLSFNPERYNDIEEKIISFSDNDSITVIINNKLNEKPFDINLNRLKSALEYKKGNFNTSFSFLNKININKKEKYNFAYELLNNENEVTLSKKIFLNIIEQSNEQELIQKSILQLALIFETETNQLYKPLKISGFYTNNIFFTHPFLKIQDTTIMYSVQRAMSIYDSLIIKNNNIDAKLRLAKINFQIMGDLDKANLIYNEILLTKYINKTQYLESVLNLINIKIAKGDLKNAMKIINEHLKKNMDDNIELYLNIKKNQILFYNNELELVLNNLEKILTESHTDLILYNDVAEIISILQIFKSYPQEYQWFTKSQFKIMQNKKIEAISIIENNHSNGSQLLIDLKNYYYAYLLFLNDNIYQALEILTKIKGNTIFSELAIIFIAEIYDYSIKEQNLAVEQYIKLIELFPDSIFYEQVRLRLRKIVNS